MRKKKVIKVMAKKAITIEPIPEMMPEAVSVIYLKSIMFDDFVDK